VSAVLSGGDVILAGTDTADTDLGCGPISVLGNYNVILARLRGSDGTCVWAEGFGTGGTFGFGVAVDSQGNVDLLAQIGDPDNLGGADLFNGNMGLAKYDAATGAHIWSRPVGKGGGPMYPSALAVDRSDNLVMAGFFSSPSFDIGGGILPYAGNNDMFLGVYDGKDGSHLYSSSYGGTNDDDAYAVAVDRRDGNVLLTGEFQLSMSVGPANLVSNGAFDVLLASLGTLP
jgi:hypothetical protein